MVKSYKVVDVAGLHARPASLLCQVASIHKNEIFIVFGEKRVTLKSILAVMSLGIPTNTSFAIDVLGENVEAVFEELEKVLIDNQVI